MKWYKFLVPAIIIGLVGGFLDEATSLNKIVCFLLGVAAFYVFLFIRACIIATIISVRRRKGKETRIDQDGDIISRD